MDVYTPTCLKCARFFSFYNLLVVYCLLVELSQGYRSTTRRQFAFYHDVPRNFRHSLDRLRKDKRLRHSWSHPVVWCPRSLDFETSSLTTRSLFHWPSRLGIWIVCRRFSIQTLLWSLESVIRNKSRAQHHRNFTLKNKSHHISFFYRY